ncbi:hypothetical protein DSO57_1023541 [Entomophthora muscae]|uniref:Uncharacterized protein n=1 Tax=Entomophthora muscae TaxID=34485 RepID=A0ACC2RTX6_9FUNG|nr:hypothetical protein DSO57_1023541 [Entomophthora muscae]
MSVQNSETEYYLSPGSTLKSKAAIELLKTQNKFLITMLGKPKNAVTPEKRAQYENEASDFWNVFYSQNEERFFKERHWLKTEFPELFTPSNQEQGENFTVMEIGCGTGSTAYPLLEGNLDPGLRVLACDFSKVAVDLCKSNPRFDHDRLKAFTWDMTSSSLPPEAPEGTVNVITLIFAFSAIQPSKWTQVVDNLYRLLKPGGFILFRDYGRYDMAQLRFKKDRYIDKNFYVRGDGTQVYFFTQDELTTIFGQRFSIEQNIVDRRLLVNRHRQLQMFRVWLQGKFVKTA